MKQLRSRAITRWRVFSVPLLVAAASNPKALFFWFKVGLRRRNTTIVVDGSY
jgi:hypothetical protein